MKATYDPESRAYTISEISAKEAHVLIWGGNQQEIDRAERTLRMALLDAEDKQMPEEHYAALFS